MNNKNSKKEIVSFINEELNNIKQLQSELSECKGNSYILRRAKGKKQLKILLTNILRCSILSL